MPTIDPEKKRAQWRLKYARNREKCIAQVRHRNNLRRAMVKISDIAPAEETEMRRKARKCPLCGVFMTGRPRKPNSKHLDHIVPLNVGGTHTRGNLRIICASCNLRRPKDGSDYSGQLTLWAEMPGVAAVVRIRPKIVRPVRKKCPCGTLIADGGRAFLCRGCMITTGRRAAELRITGKSWREIGIELGYASHNGEGIRHAAVRAGYVPEQPEPRPKPVQRSCPECGKARAKYAQWCEECTTARAWRALALREQGWTLRCIADELGYSSITSVTNLLKTVTDVETRTGRPRKAA